jgi:hypothetical protein
MTAPVAVPQFIVKSHSPPDEVRTPDKSRVEGDELFVGIGVMSAEQFAKS